MKRIILTVLAIAAMPAIAGASGQTVSAPANRSTMTADAEYNMMTRADCQNLSAQSATYNSSELSARQTYCRYTYKTGAATGQANGAVAAGSSISGVNVNNPHNPGANSTNGAVR